MAAAAAKAVAAAASSAVYAAYAVFKAKPLFGSLALHACVTSARMCDAFWLLNNVLRFVVDT